MLYGHLIVYARFWNSLKNRKEMKLAEALNLRADLQKRVTLLRERLDNNVKVQEGDEPAESPVDLFIELDSVVNQLGELIFRINKTNLETLWEGRTLTEMIADKDVLSLKLSVLREALGNANVRSDRYSRNEIKFVRTIDVAKLQKGIDEQSKTLRELDARLQQANWATDLK